MIPHQDGLCTVILNQCFMIPVLYTAGVKVTVSGGKTALYLWHSLIIHLSKRATSSGWLSTLAPKTWVWAKLLLLSLCLGVLHLSALVEQLKCNVSTFTFLSDVARLCSWYKRVFLCCRPELLTKKKKHFLNTYIFLDDVIQVGIRMIISKMILCKKAFFFLHCSGNFFICLWKVKETRLETVFILSPGRKQPTLTALTLTNVSMSDLRLKIRIKAQTVTLIWLMKG